MTRAALALLLLVSPAWADDVRVIDGDSLELRGETVRLSGIDAPEVRGKCRAERMLASVATEALQDALSGAVVTLERAGKDRYGRTLGSVYADGEDVGQALLDAGVALPWVGRRYDWCGRE